MNALQSLKLAISYIETGQYEYACGACLDALKSQPENKDAMEVLNMVLEQGGIGELPDDILSGFFIEDESLIDRAEYFGARAVSGDFQLIQDLIIKCANNWVPPNWIVHLMMAGMRAQQGDESGAQGQRTLSKFIGTILNSNGDQSIELESIGRDNGFQRGQSANNEVCFVVGYLNQRIYKIASAVRAGGGIVHLLAPEDMEISENWRMLFAMVSCWSNSTQLIELIKLLDPLVFHVFNSNYQNYAGILTALCFGNGRVVSDFYDVFDPSAAPQRFSGNEEIAHKNRQLLTIQRAIYDNVRGLCCRILYPQITKTRRAGYRQKRIYLPEYCWGAEPSPEKLSKHDGLLHVVHGGTFLPEIESGEEHTGFLWLATRAKDFGIHFHLFADTDGGLDLSEYEKLAAQSDHFHLLPAVPPEAFVAEISKYDVGISIMHPRDDIRRKSIQATVDSRGAWGNKFGDYLDAELYSLCNWRAISINYILKRYGIGEPLVPEKAITKEFWDHVKARILDQSVDFSRARKALAIDGHGKRLMKFYHEVADLAGG